MDILGVELDNALFGSGLRGHSGGNLIDKKFSGKITYCAILAINILLRKIISHHYSHEARCGSQLSGLMSRAGKWGQHSGGNQENFINKEEFSGIYFSMQNFSNR